MKDNEWGTRFWSPMPQPEREPKADDVYSIHDCKSCDTQLRVEGTVLVCDKCGWWMIPNPITSN